MEKKITNLTVIVLVLASIAGLIALFKLVSTFLGLAI